MIQGGGTFVRMTSDHNLSCVPLCRLHQAQRLRWGINIWRNISRRRLDTSSGFRRVRVHLPACHVMLTNTCSLLCMANKGPDTNGSQFFVTLRACPHLNGKLTADTTLLFRLISDTSPGKHVVFGRVIRGYDEVIQKITQVDVDQKDRPTVPVTIANCGELMLRGKPQDASPEGE